MAVDVSNHTIGGTGTGVTPDEWLRLRCIEMAAQVPNLFLNSQIDYARTYYAFIKEANGGNVIEAACSFIPSLAT
jgi:hypothetical protein